METQRAHDHTDNKHDKKKIMNKMEYLKLDCRKVVHVDVFCVGERAKVEMTSIPMIIEWIHNWIL